MFRPTEQELKAYADMKAESIIIRSDEAMQLLSDETWKILQKTV